MHNLQTYIDHLPAGGIAARVNESLRSVPRLVVTAPPGAGKSTLLPLTMLQAMGEGRIIVLEPRRIAARQIAERMAEMIGERVGETVGYRVRFETRVSKATRIEVVTEGILTRMMVDDATLDGISAVVFDEFHERSLTSDVALALVREVQQVLRPDLRIVIMSATIDTSTLCEALDAPLVESDGRMHHVDIIHADDDIDPRGIADAVARTVAKAHRQHDGDILAFLPGQAEIERCLEMLSGSLGATRVLPLYGMLSPQEQRLAISPSGDGERKVVLATPVAETSLTIEGVRVVVDSGYCRTMVFDPRNSMSHLETVRISLDMARQRAGRAGRVADGVCYRLWTRPLESRMDECRQPEIMDADMAPTLLDVAAWGGGDVMSLPWLTPPPQAHVASASALLRSLGAVDEAGHITRHGRSMQQMPCHPRVAKMMICASGDSERALAADIAALLEDKIPNSDADPDINTYIILLREARRRSKLGRWQRIATIASQYRRMAGGVAEDNAMPDIYISGRLIAMAYPERIAVSDGHCRYRLASGDYASIDGRSDLSARELLAVASLDSRVFLASPLDKSDLEILSRERDAVYWDNKEGRVIARRERRVGTILIDSRPLTDDIQALRQRAIIEAAPKYGMSMFSFGDEVQALQRRLVTVDSWHPELSLPAVDNVSVLSRIEEWLPMYAPSASTVADLRRIDLTEVIWSMLTYDQQVAVDRLAPRRLSLPSGRTVRIDYRQGAEAPVVSARLQDCFGMTDTPCLDDGRRPVLMELLSPGFKPVQLTQDMRSFWQTTYFDIRKELRRRYPKHQWPEHP